MFVIIYKEYIMIAVAVVVLWLEYKTRAVGKKKVQLL